MRLLATADLHYNHPKSRLLADDLIEQMNRAGGDVLLLVGDSAVADGDSLERCLSRFHFPGPRLFVPGNHELWTHGPDSYALFTDDLPLRIRALGWQWLQTDPFVAPGNAGDVAIVGSVGWYDYSFAPTGLGIPRRFYEHKVSPGVAIRLDEYAFLLERDDDVDPAARQLVARWNDGRFVKLGRSDDAFLGELLEQLRAQLQSLSAVPTVVAAVHHVPFRELLPPPGGAQWDFAKAYLGSERIGPVLLEFPNARHVLCGHSHYPAEAKVGHVRAVNIGSGYRSKTFKTLDL
jgi:3',5'-cyclic AMP phosphodiesterase CpdA